MNETEQRLKIAIQKSGRLAEGSQGLLNACGLNFQFQGKQLMTSVSNFPLDIFLLKNGDVLSYVEEGATELGIVGEDLIQEYEPDINILYRLEFGRCKLTVGVPKKTDITTLPQLSGTLVATSYPRITSDRLAEMGVMVQTRRQGGSVEIAPFIFSNVAAIADITESGDTMEQNGIRQLETLQEFEALLIVSPNAYRERGTKRIIDQLGFRVRRVLDGIDFRYLTLTLPEIALDFSKLKDPVNDVDLVPAWIKNAKTDKDIMLGFMDSEAYTLSRLLKEVVLWSRTRGEPWLKGEKSGNRLFIERWETDCDNDTLRIFVNTSGPVCHRGTETCFDTMESDNLKRNL